MRTRILHPPTLARLLLLASLAVPIEALAQAPLRFDVGRAEAAVTGRDSDASAPSLQESAPGLKSESTALTLSLVSTLVPPGAGIALMASEDAGGYGNDATAEIGAIVAGSALYFGPAIGYWYGGASGRGWKGVGLRFGVGAATTLGALAICGGERCGIWGDDDGAATGAALLVLAGGGFILGSAIYDIAKVKSHVREANDEKLRRSGVELSLAPTLSPAGGGTAGVVGRIRF